MMVCFHSLSSLIKEEPLLLSWEPRALISYRGNYLLTFYV